MPVLPVLWCQHHPRLDGTCLQHRSTACLPLGRPIEVSSKINRPSAPFSANLNSCVQVYGNDFCSPPPQPPFFYQARMGVKTHRPVTPAQITQRTELLRGSGKLTDIRIRC